MLGKLGVRLVAPAATALVAGALIAAASPARAQTPIGPHQYFTGQHGRLSRLPPSHGLVIVCFGLMANVALTVTMRT